jgi:hypothetical protein
LSVLHVGMQFTPSNATAPQLVGHNHPWDILQTLLKPTEKAPGSPIRRNGHFTLAFTPQHGSLFNLVEGFFSKMARSMLHYIRVASATELKAGLLACLEDINREPVIHTWTCGTGRHRGAGRRER